MDSRRVTDAASVERESAFAIKQDTPTPNAPAPVKIKVNNALKFRNFKLDPSRALEPTRKKLSTIESQRIMSVFDDSIKRVKIVTALPFIIKNMDRFRVSLGVELADLIRQHFRIQNNYQEIRNQLDMLLQNRATQAETQAKNAAAASTAEETELGETKRESYDYFADDIDYEKEASEDVGTNETEDNDGSEVSKEEKDSGKMEDKEPIAVIEEANDLDADELIQAKEKTPPSASIRSSRGDVAENVSQMINGSKEAESHVSLIDYEPRIQETMRNLGLVAQQVSHSCKNILRLFTLNPTAMNIIYSDEENMRNEGGQSIINNMIELREIMLQKLLSTPEEEMERAAYLEDIQRREHHNRAVIERLEKELKEAIEERDSEVRKNNDIIRHLQTDLHQIEKFSDENIRRTKAEAEKQELSDSKNSEQRIQKLQSEIDSLQTQVSNLITEHREIEADLRAKKYKVENEVENWIQKYDQDLGDRQDEYEEIDLIYTEEKKQLLELEERFSVLEKEYLEIMKERRDIREKREREKRDLARVVKAATTIQAFWRSYKVRKALNKKKKKQKGKKGKGKGKGKGKK